MTVARDSTADQRDLVFRKFQLGKFDPKRIVPAVSMTLSADVTALQAVRQARNAGAPVSDRVSLTHVLIKAAGIALKNFPEFFAAFDGRKLIYSDKIRINLPVAEGKHVEYVVIDSPEAKAVGEIAFEVREEEARIRKGEGTFYLLLRKAARIPAFARKLADLSPAGLIRRFNEHYGNFPITNFGSFGVENGVPAIASPAVSALCVGLTRKGPPELLPLTLVFDHRCVDGAEGGHLLVTIKDLLENQARSLF